MGAAALAARVHEAPAKSYVPSATAITSPGCAAEMAAESSAGVEAGTSRAAATRAASAAASAIEAATRRFSVKAYPDGQYATDCGAAEAVRATSALGVCARRKLC
jgi:hypothetical protein